MAIGDSITAQGSHMPHTPVGRATRDLFPALSNINAGGLFVLTLEAGPTTPTGNGTLKFYVADSTMTWTAFGDAEGPRVLIDSTRCLYVLESATAGMPLYMGAIPARKPVADKTDTVNVTGSLRLRQNCGTYGHLAWTNALMSVPFDVSLAYAIPTIRATDWWAARSQWETVYTDETIIMLGTNGSTTLALAILEAEAVEKIAKRRQGIGSTVTIYGLLPYTGAAAGVNAAMMHVNGMLRDTARRLNCEFGDAYPYLADPNGSGAYATNMAGDGLHPTALGGYVWASKGSVPVLAKRIRTTDQRSFAGIAYNATTAPYGNLLLNGLLLGTAGTKGTGVTGDVPTSHIVTREAGSIVTAVCTAPQSASPIARDDGKTGKYFRVAVDNSAGVFGEGFRIRPTAFVTANIAVGEYYIVEGDLRISGTGIQSLEVFANLDGALGYALSGIVLTANYGMYDLGGDTVTLPFKSAPLRLDTVASGIMYGIVILMQAGGTCTLDIGQTLNLHKVPAP